METVALTLRTCTRDQFYSVLNRNRTNYLTPKFKLRNNLLNMYDYIYTEEDFQRSKTLFRDEILDMNLNELLGNE